AGADPELRRARIAAGVASRSLDLLRGFARALVWVRERNAKVMIHDFTLGPGHTSRASVVTAAKHPGCQESLPEAAVEQREERRSTTAASERPNHSTPGCGRVAKRPAPSRSIDWAELR